MGRTLTTQTTNAVAATVTTPAWFIELAFSSIIRLSSRGDQSWGGQAWTGGRLKNIQIGPTGGKFLLINTDLAYSALVLNNSTTDVGCRAWMFYGDNPASDDPVLVFDGVTDGATVDVGAVAFGLAVEGSRTAFSPRSFITEAGGFNHLRPAGTKISWGGTVYELER
ncbi:hypothetical protein [Immundisolibacter sp.]